MRILLDTCTFLWMVSEPKRLSRTARQLAADPANDLYLSAVSVWEIATKCGLHWDAEGRQAHDQALERVLKACRQTGKLPGIFGGDVATTRRRVEQGFLFVTVDDMAVIGTGAQEALRRVKGLA